MFGLRLHSWYQTLQLQWRGEKLPYLQSRRDGEVWLEFLCVGYNGVLGFIWALGWWWRFAMEIEDKKEVDNMMQEVTWAMGELVYVIQQDGIAQSLLRDLEKTKAATTAPEHKEAIW
ncbi:unnamed protein product [Peniophora sp. CBMAI 1063]|nr:unnamed protein product [Peniophora sp. CBMAI 1063]